MSAPILISSTGLLIRSNLKSCPPRLSHNGQETSYERDIYECGIIGNTTADGCSTS